MNGAVPPVKVVVKVTVWSTLGVELETVKLVMTSGGMENVYVTECNEVTKFGRLT